MSNGLERLKAEGSQKIYEATHISRKNIEAIFNATYEGMTRVRLSGFLSILEREYGVDLSAVKADYISRMETAEETEKEEPFQVTAISEDPKQKSGLIIAAIVAVVVIVFLIQFLGGDTTTAEEEIETSPIVVAVVTDELNSSETNTSVEEEVVVMPTEPVLPYQLVIEPKVELWVGYIDLETLKRSQKMTSQLIELDPKKGWLLVFGHSSFKMHVGDDEVMDFLAKGKVRMIYEEGQIREIDTAEFKARNRGENW